MRPNTSERAPSPDKIRRQVDRITQSERFRESASLQKLIRFIVSETLEGHPEQLRESVIGVRVFERGEEFDGKTDNVVRVQAHRLRNRLKGYYETEGADDEVVITIPKGHYVPTFLWRSEIGTEIVSGNGASGRPESNGTGPTPRLPPMLAAVLVAGVALGVFGYAGWVAFFEGPAISRGSLEPSLQAFWGDYLHQDGVPPIAVLPTNVFLETEDGFNLIYYSGPKPGPTGTSAAKTKELEQYADPALLAAAGPLRYNSNLISVGDSHGAISLAQMFTRAGSNLLIKRSRLLNLDELQTHNVIFIGGDFGHVDMASIWGDRPFTYNGIISIVNHSPRPGEDAHYGPTSDPETGVRVTDHGLISVLPGLRVGKRITVLGGLRTEGSYAAVQFTTDATAVGELIAYFGGELPRFFQAVVRCEIVKEQVSRITLVTGRVIESP